MRLCYFLVCVAVLPCPYSTVIAAGAVGGGAVDVDADDVSRCAPIQLKHIDPDVVADPERPSTMSVVYIKVRALRSSVTVAHPHSLAAPTTPPPHRSTAPTPPPAQIHKTGSATFQTILYRFALKHKLPVVIPQACNDQSSRGCQDLGFPGPFPGKSMGQTADLRFNVLGAHAVLNAEAMSTMVPNATFVTMVREPVSLLVSFLATFGECSTLRRAIEAPGLRCG